MGLRPPDEIDGGTVILRRGRLEDVEAVAAAVAQSLEHLRPWMPWATDEARAPGAQRKWVLDGDRRWDEGKDFHYLIWGPDGREVLGIAGLHRRVGPDGIEIGYWVHVDHLRHGHATAAAKALTATALALPGISRVEIHCDAANAPSAAVARSLGFRLAREEPHPVEAPSESGRRMIWTLERGRDEAVTGEAG